MLSASEPNDHGSTYRPQGRVRVNRARANEPNDSLATIPDERNNPYYSNELPRTTRKAYVNDPKGPI